MKYALIDSEGPSRIFEVSDAVFEIHEGFRWVECDVNVTPEFTYDGFSFTPPPVLDFTEGAGILPDKQGATVPVTKV
jgi:hypothetical protein